MKLALIPLLFAVAACAVAPESQSSEVLSARIAGSTQADLCSAYSQTNTTPRGKLMIEAELATRGVDRCASGNYGRLSVGAFGSPQYVRPSVATPSGQRRDLNCSDFPSGAAAQKYFLATGGPVNDPNNLDGDGDGLACEWGPQISRIANYSPPIAVPVRRYTPRCYTGPRGGTYTITASGNKNYSGC